MVKKPHWLSTERMDPRRPHAEHLLFQLSALMRVYSKELEFPTGALTATGRVPALSRPAPAQRAAPAHRRHMTAGVLAHTSRSVFSSADSEELAKGRSSALWRTQSTRVRIKEPGLQRSI